jgi:hypothetical protein
MDELIYYSLHIYYYALYGKLGEVRGSKLEILFKYNVIIVLDVMLNNEANKLKRRPHSNMRPLLLKETN